MALSTCLTLTLVFHFGVKAFDRKFANRVLPVTVKVTKFSATVTWLIIGLILNVFVSQLAIAFYTPQQLRAPLYNFTQLLQLVSQGHWQLIYEPNSLVAQQIQTRLSLSADQLSSSEHFLKIANFGQIGSLLRERPNRAYVDSAMFLDIWNAPCDIAWVTESGMSAIPAGFYYRQAVPKKFRLTYAQQKVAFDLFTALKGKYKRSKPKRECSQLNMRMVDSLNPDQTASIYCAVVGGFGTALAAFIIERLTAQTNFLLVSNYFSQTWAYRI